MAVDDAYTVALLHMDGADASTTFTDESGKTWTANNSVQIDTAQSKFGGASGLFGSANFLSTPDSDDWQLDGGSNSNTWTWDAWLRFDGGQPSQNGIFQQRGDNNNFFGLYLDVALDTFTFEVRSGGSSIVLLSFEVGASLSTDTWYHIALVKNGTNGYMVFVDGVQVGGTQTDNSPIPNFSASMFLGRFTLSNGNNRYHYGWMDEVRFSKGIARWTANFTPPTEPYGPPAGGGYRKLLPSRRAPHITPFAGWKRVRGILRPPEKLGLAF